MLLVFSSNLKNASQPTKDLSTLQDYFTGPAIDTSKWTVTNGSNGSVSTLSEIVNGKLQFTVPTGFIGGAQIRTPVTQLYKFNANSAYFKLALKNTDHGAESWFEIQDYEPNVNLLGLALQWYFTDTAVEARTVGQYNFVTSTLVSLPYDSNAHAWFRIRETSGTTYWETAPSTAQNPPASNEWVVRASQANYITGTGVSVKFAARNFSNPANANITQFDSINSSTAPYVAPAVSTLTDTFSAGVIDTTKWSTIGADTNTVIQTGGKLVFGVAAGTLGGCGLTSQNTYKFTSSSAFTKITQTTDYSGTDAAFELRDLTNGVAGLGVQWYFTAGVVNARTIDSNGIGTIVSSITYNSATPWFRIRETNGTVYWETAPNTAQNPPLDNQWVVQYSQARAMFGATVTVKYIVRHLQTGVDAQYSFDSINTATAITSPVRYIRDHVENSSKLNNHWVEIQALDASGTVVSVGATVTANTPINYGSLSYITNGNTDTSEYADFGNPAGGTTVTIDLGTLKDITSVNVRHYYGDARTYFNCKTEVSPDGITWYTTWDYAAKGTYAETSAGRTDAVPLYSYVVPTSPVRYVRDWLTGSNVNTGNHWVEVQAIDANGINQALNAAVTPNGVAYNSSAFVTDGDINTNNYYGVNDNGIGNVTIDLGSRKNIASIKRWHYFLDGRTYYSNKTEVSPDGVTWYTVFDGSVSGNYSETSLGKSDNVPIYTFVPDTTAPTITNATLTNVIGKNKLRLVASEALANQLPAIGQFTISNHSVTGINFLDTNRTDIILTVADNFGIGENVAVSYVAPVTNPVTDISGNLLAAFSNRAVSNSLTTVPVTRLRYIREYIDGCNDAGTYQEWSDFAEVQAYDIAGTNLALGASVTASWTTDPQYLNKLVDGDVNINFYAGTDGKSMTIDLGEVKDIASIRTWHNTSVSNRYYFETVFISSDGINWTAIWDTETQSGVNESGAGHLITAPFSGSNIPYYWQYIGGENAGSAVADNTLVRYGARPNYSYATKSGYVTLDNNTFGDPAPGVVKHGDQRIVNPAYVEPVVAHPTVISTAITAAVGDTKIRVQFSDPMANVNPYAQFAVSGHTISSAVFVDQSRTYLDLIVTTAFVPNEVVTLSYTQPTTTANGYQSASGVVLFTFNNLAVTNTLSIPGTGTATIIVRNIVRPAIQQPQIIVPIYRQNPVVRGLTNLVMPGISNRDLVANKDWFFVYGSNGVNRIAFQKGRALNAAGFSAGVATQYSLGTNLIGSNTNFSFLVVVYKHANVGSGNNLARVFCQGNDQSGFEFNFGNGYGQSYENARARFGGPTLSNSSMYINGINQPNIASTGMTMDLNPKQVYTCVASGFNGNNAFISSLFNSNTDSDPSYRTLFGGILLFALWNRSMSPREQQSLSVNPWQLFPQYQKRYMSLNVAASTYAAHMPFFVF